MVDVVGALVGAPVRGAAEAGSSSRYAPCRPRGSATQHRPRSRNDSTAMTTATAKGASAGQVVPERGAVSDMPDAASAEQIVQGFRKQWEKPPLEPLELVSARPPTTISAKPSS